MNFPEESARCQLSVQRPSPDVVVVTVAGDLSTPEAPRLRELLQHRVSGCLRAVVVDLTDVSFFNSQGLEALGECALRAADQGVTLRLVCVPGGRVERVVDLAGMGTRFTVRPSVYSTLNEFQPAKTASI